MELSAELHRRLRETLQGCQSLLTNEHLQAMFTDDRLSPWRPRLPTVHTTNQIIAALIGLLIDGVHDESGRSALVLFLEVYSEQFHTGDSCRRQVSTLARELEQKYLPGSPAQVQPDSQKPQKSKGNMTTIVGEGGNIGQQVNIQTHQGELHLGDVNMGARETRPGSDRGKEKS